MSKMINVLTNKDAKRILAKLKDCITSTEMDYVLNRYWRNFTTDALFLYTLLDVLRSSQVNPGDIYDIPQMYYAHQIPKEEITFKNEAEKYWYLYAKLEFYTMKKNRRAPKVMDLLYLFSELGKASSEKHVKVFGKEKQVEIIKLIKQIKEQLYEHHTVDRIEDSNTAYLASALLFTNDEPDFYINLGKEIMRFDTLEPLANDSQIVKNFTIPKLRSIEKLIKKIIFTNEHYAAIYYMNYNNYKGRNVFRGSETVQEFRRFHIDQLNALLEKMNFSGVISDTLKAYTHFVNTSKRIYKFLNFQEDLRYTRKEKHTILSKVLFEVETTIKTKDNVSILAGGNTIDDLVSLILSPNKASCKEVVIIGEKHLIGYLLYRFAGYYKYPYNQIIRSITDSNKLYTANSKSEKKLQNHRTTVLEWYKAFESMPVEKRLMWTEIKNIIAKYFPDKTCKN